MAGQEIPLHLNLNNLGIVDPSELDNVSYDLSSSSAVSTHKTVLGALQRLIISRRGPFELIEAIMMWMGMSRMCVKGLYYQTQILSWISAP